MSKFAFKFKGPIVRLLALYIQSAKLNLTLW